MKILNITNGTCTLDLMQAASIEGDAFSWDDVLHEGPVPSGLTLEKLSEVRAGYISSQGWASKDETLERFKVRDSKLNCSHQYDEVILWFEHDLYDQLQLIQILNWFKSSDVSKVNLFLINPDKHLGHHQPDEFSQLLKLKTVVTAEQLTIAEKAWNAFVSDSPILLNELLGQDLSPLPFLKAALSRLLEEFPDAEKGIPKTERLILECLEELNEPAKLGELFRAYCQKEDAEFLGDTVFFERLNQMTFCENPLIELNSKERIGYPFNKDLTIKKLRNLEDSGLWFFENDLRKDIGGISVSNENQFVWKNNQVALM